MKKLNYPTQEWLDKWMDKWMDDNPEVKVSDFDALKEKAEGAWWDKEVEKGNPTPYDMTEAEAKASKAVRSGIGHAPKKERKPRERKPNEEKRDLIAKLAELFPNCEIVNAEREISFTVGENAYSLTLTCHRKPKA